MPDSALGIYIHWPFCQAKCPYCDFNSHVTASVDHSAWSRAYAAEIARFASMVPDRLVGSIFFGGGTPSLMDPETVAHAIDEVRRHWRTINDVEITLEANPTSVEAGRFRGYRDAGVNRVSIGIQALNDADLRRLGRLHNTAEARAAYDIARQTFERTSFDLIYGRQDQSLSDWTAELTEALGMASDHLSLYQLTIEDGTAFGDRLKRGGLTGLPGEDLGADLYEVTQELCVRAGMPAYEISNHARPGAESRHNMVYWAGGDYVGIGPGAHGRLTIQEKRYATEALSQPKAWLDRVVADAPPDRMVALTNKDVWQERLMMGLRVRKGVEIGILERLGTASKADHLHQIGLLRTDEGRIVVTDQGRPLLNAIVRELMV